ncbi:MAG: TIGR03768 family metallophosphoesterase [Rhodoferax sp.]
MLNNNASDKSACANTGAPKRRDFLRYSAGSLTSISLSSLTFGCASVGARPVQRYPIDANVATTAQRMISFPAKLAGIAPNEIDKVAQYNAFGYGNWSFGAGLPVLTRTDIMPAGYSKPGPGRSRKLLNFFAFTDIHITDKEAPNQLMLLQQFERYAINNTSIYSPVMMYTTHVLDAAIQTINALHKRNPVDFGISLGDTCNSTQYNELRWYLDVIDGKVINPSSGAHVGADSIDYQKPYQAAGLDKSIPWYQVMGNHDHFFIGSFPVDADPSVGLRQSYTAGTVWAVADALTPRLKTFPALFNMKDLQSTPKYYMGVFDGSSPYGNIIHTGLASSPAFAAGAPKVAADPDRRSLMRAEWVQEFFNTSTGPVGHGFNLVDRTSPHGATPGFTCYSFVPRKDVPLKVIVLDNTQSEADGSNDIHGHGYLDAARWAWLKAELAAGQAADQLMIVAAHVPIGVAAIGSEMEWWLNEPATLPEHRNAVDLAGLVSTLQNTPNLILWMAGHRHVNAVKAFKSPDPAQPERGFWQVETSSLRDFPQQLRTFEIYLHSDYTISIVTTNVDPAVAEGTPAATSRKYAVAVQQIVGNDLKFNTPNIATIGPAKMPLPSMDPSRPQDGKPDPTIQYTDLAASGVPYNASYNAELCNQLSPRMIGVLKGLFAQQATV